MAYRIASLNYDFASKRISAQLQSNLTVPNGLKFVNINIPFDGSSSLSLDEQAEQIMETLKKELKESSLFDDTLPSVSHGG